MHIVQTTARPDGLLSELPLLFNISIRPPCNIIHVGSETYCGMKGKGMYEACGLAFLFVVIQQRLLPTAGADECRYGAGRGQVW